jgi:CxxC-x17-CxxC domain-containing protein
MFTDKTLTCRECGSEFLFSASEQEFFAEKGFENEPGRCPACRTARKAQSRGARQMFPVICSDCGKETTVPFEPNGSKPVYCSECFQAHRQSW